eukprot:11184902-Lingulodinium_polyedra.AAC.1
MERVILRAACISLRSSFQRLSSRGSGPQRSRMPPAAVLRIAHLVRACVGWARLPSDFDRGSFG